MVHRDVKDPEKSEKSQSSAKVFNPTSSFDVYGDEEGAASTSLSFLHQVHTV